MILKYQSVLGHHVCKAVESWDSAHVNTTDGDVVLRLLINFNSVFVVGGYGFWNVRRRRWEKGLYHQYDIPKLLGHIVQ